jgi:Ca2+-binding EF-hand superfamily protein
MHRGLEMDVMQAVFNGFDEDDMGVISVAEFRYGIQKLVRSRVHSHCIFCCFYMHVNTFVICFHACAVYIKSQEVYTNANHRMSSHFLFSILSTSFWQCEGGMEKDEMDMFVRLTDANNDGSIDFSEFMAIMRADAQPVTRVLTRKLIRSQMPSPMEHVLTFYGNDPLPSHYRRCILAAYDHEPAQKTSSALHPHLDGSGLALSHFRLNPNTQQLHPCATAAAAAGIANGGVVSGGVAVEVQLDAAVNIPLPVRFVGRSCSVLVICWCSLCVKVIVNLDSFLSLTFVVLCIQCLFNSNAN